MIALTPWLWITSSSDVTVFSYYYAKLVQISNGGIMCIQNMSKAFFLFHNNSHLWVLQIRWIKQGETISSYNQNHKTQQLLISNALYRTIIISLFNQSHHQIVPLPYKMHVNDACALFPLLKGSGLNICVTTCRPKIKTSIKDHRSKKRKALWKKNYMYIKARIFVKNKRQNYKRKKYLSRF